MHVFLQVLKLQACKYLTDSSLEPLYKNGALPLLSELDLSYGTLCQSAIEELLACCTQLTHVSLNGCINMHDLNWGYGANQQSELATVSDSSGLPSQADIELSSVQPNRLLQNLNCVGCPNIKKVLIPSMARCFNLSSLNLSLSANLKEVDISCLNLCFLNLRYYYGFRNFEFCNSFISMLFIYYASLFSNCCSLETLKLECPKLTSLFLQVCILPCGWVWVAS